ncbi:MAG: Rpn family recombination-promoting nuclease/putative transposase [Bacteroidales bacterium]
MFNNKNLIRFDWAIKRLLRNKADFSVLEGFLSELLREDVQIQNVLESESNQKHSFDKYNRVDILVKNSKDELVIIEIQNQTEYDYFHRMVYGASKTLTEYMSLGETYEAVKKVYTISIVYFDLGQGDDYVYRGKTDFIGIHKADKLMLSTKQTKMFGGKIEPSQILPEYYLIKVNQFDGVAKDTLDQWIYYLKTNDIKDNFTAKGINKARERWRFDTLPEEERRRYNRHLKNLMDEASSIRSQKIDAEDKARKELAKEIAKTEREAKRAKAATKKAEAEKKKAEAEKKKAEAETKKAEAETKRAETKTRKAEAEKKKAEDRAKQAEAEIANTKRAIAKGLKDEDVEISVIQELTGLSKKEIDAL